MRQLSGKKILSIGPSTPQSHQSFGIRADKVAETYVQEGILDCLNHPLDKENILIPTSTGARNDLANGLQKRGSAVSIFRFYETRLPKTIKKVAIRDHDVVLFTSSSTARHFFQSDVYQGEDIVSVCLSDVTAKTVRQFRRRRVHVSDTATIEGLVKQIL